MTNIPRSKTSIERLISQAQKSVKSDRDRSIRALRTVIRRRLKNRKAKPPTEAFEAPPNLQLKKRPLKHGGLRHHHPQHDLLQRGFRKGCWRTIFTPPYLNGTPESAVQTVGTAYPGIVGYALAVPEEGRMKLLATTYNDDSTATPNRQYDGRSRVVTAELWVVYHAAPFPGLTSKIRVQARLEAIGASLMLARGDWPPTGKALAFFGAALQLYSQSKHVAQQLQPPYCRTLGRSGNVNEDIGKVSQLLSVSKDLTAELIITAPQSVAIIVSTTLIVGVTDDSNIYVACDLSNDWILTQGLDGILVPHIIVDQC